METLCINKGPLKTYLRIRAIQFARCLHFKGKGNNEEIEIETTATMGCETTFDTMDPWPETINNIKGALSLESLPRKQICIRIQRQVDTGMSILLQPSCCLFEPHYLLSRVSFLLEGGSTIPTSGHINT